MNSSQIIAAVAITAVLAAGAYALGRSQGTPAAPEAPATAAVVAAVEAPKLAMVDTKAETQASSAEAAVDPAPLTQASLAPTVPASLCNGCLRVVGVHAEQRKAESGSGAGAVGGAVLGGLLGNRVGGGTGRKLATLGGAVAGGFAGNEIEKNVNKKTVWVVELKSADGHIRHREQSSDPQLQTGDVVSIRDGHLVRR